MNRPSVILLLTLTLILTACSGNASNTASPASGNQNGPGAGELSMPTQIAIGTIKLDGTDNAVTKDQAAELLPLWETLQLLDSSDTAATQEKDALLAQIQETMTQQQMQAITALGLTRQDMLSIMQSRVQTLGGPQNGTSQNGNSSSSRNNAGGGFGPGGPPPDGGGGFAGGGNPNFQGQGQRSQSGSSTNTNTQPAAVDPNRIPTPLIQAVIEYLKTKTG